MNILIFTSIYPAPAEYGIPNDTKVVHYYAKQWQKAGHMVQVIYLHMIPVKRLNAANLKKRNGFESDYQFDGINVHLLQYQLFVPRTNWLLDAQAKNAEERVKTFIGGSFVPDRVFVHFPCSFKGMNCVSDFCCPTMAVLHNVDLNTLRRKTKLSTELKRYKNIGGRNKQICDAASLLLTRQSVPVLSGIDEDLIAPTDMIERKLSQLPHPVRIVYAGNLIKLKKVDVLLRALQQVGFDYRCEIIGDGPEKKRLETIAAGDSRIVFHGRLSREATIEKMREADVFVMVSSPETFGLVYLEAMAQGCITIGSKNEGIDGVIKDSENGFLVQPGDVRALVDCLESIVAMDVAQKQTLVRAAYYDASHMTDARMAEKYLQLNE